MKKANKRGIKMQLNIFSAMYPRYKINKPIRLYTLFSGYDSQALALKYLGVEFEHYKTCEWAVNSIQALKDLHFKQDHTDYSAPHAKILLNNLRIRKLTPKECFRLMGVRDCDSDNITESDANKYHLAGDSIVVDALMAIFKQML